MLRMVEPAPDQTGPPPPPTESEWARQGWTVVGELHGGHQSRVYTARAASGELVVKLTDRRSVDDAYVARLELASELASADTRIVGPLRHHGSLASELGEWFAVTYPIVEGRHPVHSDRADVTDMGVALASVHRSMRALVIADVPRVAALRGSVGELHGAGPDQLLHGDYSSANVVMTDQGMRIIDLDDAGWGPVEFEIGNTLYMALFDATLRDEVDGYRQFRAWFVDSYVEAAAGPLQLEVVEAAIRLRKRALAGWLDDLRNAPPGIRSASPEWRRVLRRFSTAL